MPQKSTNEEKTQGRGFGNRRPQEKSNKPRQNRNKGL